MLETLNQPYIILAASILITAGVRCFSNIYSKKYTNNTADTAFFTLCSAALSLIVVLVFVLLDGFRGVSWFTFLLAILFAAVSFINTYTATRALVLGPLAYTSVIAAASSIIPVLYGRIFLGEQITVFQIIGMVLILISVFLSVETQGEKKKASLRWLGYALLNFLMNGTIGVLQKIHRASAHAHESNEYLLIMFFFMALITAGYLVILRKKGTVRSAKPLKMPKVFLVLLAAGVLAGLINVLNLYLSGAFDAAFLFPVLNGGGTLAALILAFVVFKEKFTLRRSIGLAVGVLALMFLFGIVQIILKQFGV
ncbi:MAG: EamA family transporter [Lachnospiraceae bacterium]|nr:EamA family transporter [Lachnospiraceae bacterium]